MYSNPSDKWDKKEHKMDEEDMPEEGPKVEVQVNTGPQHGEEVPLSGLFCVWCHDFAIHIFEGSSLCHDCFNKEISERVKRNK